jgi:hypothetical protein
MGYEENALFGLIAKRLDNFGLRSAVSVAAEGLPSIDLHQELETLTRCINKANDLIQKPGDNGDYAGISNARRILNEHRLESIPVPFSTMEGSRAWLHSLRKIVEVGNTEISNSETKKTYKDPERIKVGNPLSVFRWYLYDGVGRMEAIHLEITNDDKRQETEGDWITCALSEAAVVLAEEGDQDARGVVKDMMDMGFIAKGWLLTDGVINRAQAIFA